MAKKRTERPRRSSGAPVRGTATGHARMLVHAPEHSASWSEWLAPMVIALVTFVAFYPSLRNGFVDFDDDQALLLNPRYRGLGWANLGWMFTTLHMGHYQPLSWFTLGLDHLLWGMSPWGYHLTSLLLHVANGVLFYFVCLRLLRLAFPDASGPGERALRAASGVAALLFAIHPLRVESVAWVTERRDVLSALFFLATILCYLRRHTETAEPGTGWRWTALALSFYVLSLLSKAGGMLLPFVLVVLDVYPLRRLRGSPTGWWSGAARRAWWEKCVYLVPAVVFAAVAFIAQQQSGAMKPL